MCATEIVHASLTGRCGTGSAIRRVGTAKGWGPASVGLRCRYGTREPHSSDSVTNDADRVVSLGIVRRLRRFARGR